MSGAHAAERTAVDVGRELWHALYAAAGGVVASLGVTGGHVPASAVGGSAVGGVSLIVTGVKLLLSKRTP